MDKKLIRVLADGQKNCHLQISGVVGGAIGCQIDPKELAPPASQLRIDRIIYALGKGAEAVLWWDCEPKGVIAALEGRGTLDLNGLGVASPGKCGMYVELVGDPSHSTAFSIFLDLEKQGVV